MSYWHFLIIAAAAILCSMVAYIAIHWRKAPVAFRAMNLVAMSGLAAGLLAGIWSLHVFTGAPAVESGAAGSAVPPAGVKPSATSYSAGSIATPDVGLSTPALATTACSPGAVSTREVAHALLVAHLNGSFLQRTPLDNYDAKECAKSDPEGASARCRAAFLGRHALGLDLEHGGAPRCVSYDEVAEFCDLKYLDEDSALCAHAYQARNERRRELGR